MTNKQKTIKAFKELEQKYRNPDGKIFSRWAFCPLCKIYDVTDYSSCVGCVLCSNSEVDGCSEFSTFDRFLKYHKKISPLMTYGTSNVLSGWYTNVDLKLFTIFQRFIFKRLARKRGNFFRKYLPVIEKWNESRFTKNGWVYSGDEILRSD